MRTTRIKARRICARAETHGDIIDAIEKGLILEARNTELLAALKLAEPILDAASATDTEDGGTMIPGARPVWDAVRSVILGAATGQRGKG